MLVLRNPSLTKKKHQNYPSLHPLRVLRTRNGLSLEGIDMDTSFRLGNLISSECIRADFTGILSYILLVLLARSASAIYYQHLRKGLPSQHLWSDVPAPAD